MEGEERRGGSQAAMLAENRCWCDLCSQNTPLHWAAYNNRVEACKMLVEAGADMTAKDVRMLWRCWWRWADSCVCGGVIHCMAPLRSASQNGGV